MSLFYTSLLHLSSLETNSGQKEPPKSPVNDQKQTEKSSGGEKKEKSGKGSYNKRRGGKAPQQNKETVKDNTKEASKPDMSGLSRFDISVCVSSYALGIPNYYEMVVVF